MITFKNFLITEDDDFALIKMLAGMYTNLNTDVREVNVTYTKSKFNMMKSCFYNAERVVKKNSTSSYVLGYVLVHGVPLEHAWVKLSSGNYIDTTINTPDQYTYYSCLELTHDELVQSIAKCKSKAGYIDLATLNRYTKKD